MDKQRSFAAALALVIGTIIMVLKFYVYHLTNSTAVLSDAMESVVNVIAASFALFAIRIAHEPPDENHPYGHGKIEFITAVFEGGLITFAALMIAYEAVHRILSGGVQPNLDSGLSFLIIAGILNGLLGVYLIRTGKKTHSIALEADGKHVLSDCYTSIGIILGLGLVKITNLPWLDPLIALLMAAILAYTGIPLVKNAIGALLDEANLNLLEKLAYSLEKHRSPGIIDLHHVRAMRNGRRIHVDGHIVLPDFWSVEMAHDTTEVFADKLVKDLFLEGEVEFHTDPCRRMYCKNCDLENCPIRVENFTIRKPMKMAEITSPIDKTNQAFS